MNTATFIKDIRRFRGSAKLYRLDPPAPLGRWQTHDTGVAEHVVVSAVDVPNYGPETYIFPADADGQIVTWGNLDGSFRGGIDHEKALRDAGYEVVS